MRQLVFKRQGLEFEVPSLIRGVRSWVVLTVGGDNLRTVFTTNELCHDPLNLLPKIRERSASVGQFGPINGMCCHLPTLVLQLDKCGSEVFILFWTISKLELVLVIAAGFNLSGLNTTGRSVSKAMPLRFRDPSVTTPITRPRRASAISEIVQLCAQLWWNIHPKV